MLSLITRLFNGFITLFIFYKLYILFKQTQRRFYLYWSTGFLFYGANIILRLFIPEIEINPIGVLAFLLNLLGFILMMSGIGELVNKAKITLMLTLTLQAILFLIMYRYDNESLAWVMLLVPHIVITSSLVYLYTRFKVDVLTIVVGWVPILMANIALSANLLDILYIDLISGVSKIIVYYGMSKPSFSVLVDDLREFMLTGMPSEYAEEHKSGITIIKMNTNSKSKEIEWIKHRIRDNNKRGIRTILFSYYDIIHPSVFQEELDEMLYLVRVMQDRNKYTSLFENKITTVNDDLNILHRVISDIINASRETTIPADIIIYTLSQIILMKGSNRIYTIMVSKNPELKEGNVSLSCIIHPDVHEDHATVSKFESISRETIQFPYD